MYKTSAYCHLTALRSDSCYSLTTAHYITQLEAVGNQLMTMQMRKQCTSWSSQVSHHIRTLPSVDGINPASVLNCVDNRYLKSDTWHLVLDTLYMILDTWCLILDTPSSHPLHTWCLIFVIWYLILPLHTLILVLRDLVRTWFRFSWIRPNIKTRVSRGRHLRSMQD